MVLDDLESRMLCRQSHRREKLLRGVFDAMTCQAGAGSKDAQALFIYFVCASIQHFVIYLLLTQPLKCLKLILCTTVADDNDHLPTLLPRGTVGQKSSEDFYRGGGKKREMSPHFKANAQFTPGLEIESQDESDWVHAVFWGIHFG